MAVDPTISLQGNYPNPTQPQGIDLASIYGAALKIKQQQQDYAQQQQAVQKANSLRAILSAPGAVDPATGKVTNNALKALWSADTDVAQKVISSNAQIDDREAQAAKYKSDASIADMKRNAQAIRDGLAVYRASTSEAGNDPGVAKDIMMDGLRDHLKGLGYSPDRTAAIWGKISTMEPAQLEALATSWSTAADSAAEEAKRLKRDPVVIDGKTYFAGEEANPDTGAIPITDAAGHPVDASGKLIEKAGTAEDPTRAAQGQAGIDARNRHEAFEEGKRTPYMMGNQEVTMDAHGNFYDQNGHPTEVTGKLSKIGSNTARSGTALAMQKFMEANPDATPEEIAHFSAGYTAAVRQAGAIGTRRGQVEFSEAELENAAKLSHDAYVKLPRGQFLPFNELTKKIETATSSPEQAAAYAADNTVVNTYARMVSPTGVGTDSDKQHAREMLNTAQSQEAHQAVIDQLMAEGRASRAGAQTALDESADEPVVSSAPAHRATPPPPAPPKGERPPYPGARLSPRDNQWYVQKDGKWFRVD